MQWSHYAFIYCTHCNCSFTRPDSGTSFNDVLKERIYLKKKNPTSVSHNLTFYCKFLEREIENINNGFSEKIHLFGFLNSLSCFQPPHHSERSHSESFCCTAKPRQWQWLLYSIESNKLTEIPVEKWLMISREPPSDNKTCLMAASPSLTLFVSPGFSHLSGFQTSCLSWVLLSHWNVSLLFGCCLISFF